MFYDISSPFDDARSLDQSVCNKCSNLYYGICMQCKYIDDFNIYASHLTSSMIYASHLEGSSSMNPYTYASHLTSKIDADMNETSFNPIVSKLLNLNINTQINIIETNNKLYNILTICKGTYRHTIIKTCKSIKDLHVTQCAKCKTNLISFICPTCELIEKDHCIKCNDNKNYICECGNIDCLAFAQIPDSFINKRYFNTTNYLYKVNKCTLELLIYKIIIFEYN